MPALFCCLAIILQGVGSVSTRICSRCYFTLGWRPQKPAVRRARVLRQGSACARAFRSKNSSCICCQSLLCYMPFPYELPPAGMIGRNGVRKKGEHYTLLKRARKGICHAIRASVYPGDTSKCWARKKGFGPRDPDCCSGCHLYRRVARKPFPGHVSNTSSIHPIVRRVTTCRVSVHFIAVSQQCKKGGLLAFDMN